MRIRIPSVQELNPGHPKHDGDPSHPIINGILPSLETCEITDDDGKPIDDVAAIDIRIRPGEAVSAIVKRYDVHGEINAAVVQDVVAEAERSRPGEALTRGDLLEMLERIVTGRMRFLEGEYIAQAIRELRAAGHLNAEIGALRIYDASENDE